MTQKRPATTQDEFRLEGLEGLIQKRVNARPCWCRSEGDLEICNQRYKEWLTLLVRVGGFPRLKAEGEDGASPTDNLCGCLDLENEAIIVDHHRHRCPRSDPNLASDLWRHLLQTDVGREEKCWCDPTGRGPHLPKCQQKMAWFRFLEYQFAQKVKAPVQKPGLKGREYEATVNSLVEAKDESGHAFSVSEHRYTNRKFSAENPGAAPIEAAVSEFLGRMLKALQESDSKPVKGELTLTIRFDSK